MKYTQRKDGVRGLVCRDYNIPFMDVGYMLTNICIFDVERVQLYIYFSFTFFALCGTIHDGIYLKF
jgi:hypothetical protein